MKRFVVLVLLVHLGGCGNLAYWGLGVKYPMPSSGQSTELPPGFGVMLASAGREVRGGPLHLKPKLPFIVRQLPFVTYYAFRETGTGALELEATLPADMGKFSELGKGKEGHIHVLELPAGKYVLCGQAARGTLADQQTALQSMIDNDYRTDKLNIAIEFEVLDGEGVYLGELLVLDENTRFGSVPLVRSDQFERDHRRMRKRFPALAEIEFVKRRTEGTIAKLLFF